MGVSKGVEEENGGGDGSNISPNTTGKPPSYTPDPPRPTNRELTARYGHIHYISIVLWGTAPIITIFGHINPRFYSLVCCVALHPRLQRRCSPGVEVAPVSPDCPHRAIPPL